MTTLKDISDTYDLKELNTNVRTWMKNHTPTVEDVEMYLIRLRTLTYLINYSDNPLVVQTFDALASQLNEKQRCALMARMIERPNRTDNITFLSAISNSSPAAEQVLLAAWVPSDTAQKTANAIISVLSINNEYNGVLFGEGFFNDQNYLNFLRTEPKHLFDLLLRQQWNDESLQRLARTQLVHEELLFPLLAQIRQTNQSPAALIECWNTMFPQYVLQEATRIAMYIPSHRELEHFITTVPMDAQQQFSVLLKWVSFPNTQMLNTTIVHVLNNIEWDDKKFAALKNAYMLGNGLHYENVEEFSAMWVRSAPETLHDYLYPHIHSQEFSDEHNWVRQKLILKRETQEIPPSSSHKLQRKI